MNIEQYLNDAVPESVLIEKGFHKRGRHTYYKRIHQQEYRFTEVAARMYAFDGIHDFPDKDNPLIPPEPDDEDRAVNYD